MMKIKIIVLLGLFILAAACQKRKYPAEQVQLEKEDIYFNGYIDNEPVTLKIGTDGYYCYSSYLQRPDSIYVFEGTLKKFNCNPCPQSLQVELSDYKQRSIGSSVPVDSALRTGSRNFIPGMAEINTVYLASHSNKEVSSIRWDVSNGASFNDSIFICEFAQQGAQTVSLTVTTKNNCESRVVNKIFVGGAGGLFACNVTAQALQSNKAQFNRDIIGGKPPYLYTWNFGDGSTSNLPTPNHDYKYAGSYPVILKIVDAENHICETSYLAVVGNDKSSCTANMTFTRKGSRNAFLNGVKIQWTDQSNITLRSDSVGQPAGSYFEVVSSTPYAANERGEAGQLLTLRFNVLLSGGGRKIWFKSENTAIAVTYK